MPTAIVKVLDKAIDLLFLFSHDCPVLSLAEIAARLGVPESTAYRLLVTLCKKNVIVRDAQTRKYGLDARVLRLEAAVDARLDITQIAMTHLQELAARSGETAQVYVRQGDDVVCVEMITSAKAIRLLPEKGVPCPLHAGAPGRVVLAFLPETFLVRYIKQNGLRAIRPDTLTDPRELRAVLARAREKGYAISFQEWVEGARGVAAPFFDHQGEVVGSLEVSGPDPRFSESKAREVAPLLLEHARAFSVELGAQNPCIGPARNARPVQGPGSARQVVIKPHRRFSAPPKG